ncbi:LamG domain-containing protein [Streptomyces sp. LaPpAH-108]|uniref:LamG domain-containing protein n=1 Tax=Streptomyces sp. LaPpAH-108 TaxID=1155714 RepID=UPI000D0AABCA|nr:LamG-like jellyroll fold domain-containing protein [Streptomyces sp. LaPpAH-108]
MVGAVPQMVAPHPAHAAPAAAAEDSTTAGRRSADAALAQARRSGKNVEVMSLRGESSDVYATPDGDFEAREYLRPVRVRSADGWKDIDTDLVKADDGGLVPKATSIGLEFSGGGQTPLVKMTKAGRELSLSWPTPLPTPEVSGDIATYHDVLPGVDVRMGAQEDGFTQLLVVKSAEAAASKDLAEIRLKLAADGMNVEETSDGGLQAVDNGAGGAVFEAPKPVMWDSSPGSSTAQSKTAPNAELRDSTGPEPGAGESGKLAAVEVDVPQDGKELVLTPDADVLKGQDTQYPVFIDPQWYSPLASAWTVASKYWASSPQWKFNGASDSGMGYCNWSYCNPNDTKRLFYRLPVSKFSGKSILSAEFVVRNTWSASCSAREVELWQTKGISDSTTWNSQNASGFWIKQLASDSFAYGYSGCSAKDAEFDVKSALQAAASAHDSTMTFGLRAGSESDGYGWKRFSDKAHLRVKYNRPPAQLKSSQLTMEYGGTCKPSSSPAHVRTMGQIYAGNVTDPDGDSVAVEFQAVWAGGSWKPAKTTSKKSGSDFSISLPSSIPTDKTVNWYARVYDGVQYSPWSYAGDPQACYFIYDTKVPKAPTVSSGEYPVSNPADPDDLWYDGVGRYGSFEVKAADTDVSTYWYGINGDPSSKNKITTSGGAARIAKVLPAKPGLNFFTAQAFDPAGNGSEIRTYQYRVKAGQPARATWQLDEAAGASEAKGSTPDRSLVLSGGAAPGAEGVQGTAVHFNGTDGYASTDLSPVNTSGGFAISAWVKLDKIPDATADVALIPGNNAPGMELYYSTKYGWAFNQYKSDDAAADIARADQGSSSQVRAGVWTHLVGSYSSASDQLQLFVDGTLVKSVDYATAWEARRGLQIGGKNLTGTAPVSLFPGTIDEVQLFDKPLAQNEVDKLNAQQTVGDPGRPAIAVFDLDEPAAATEITGHGGVLPARYNGTVTTGVEGIAGKATHFDGTSGYAKIGQTSGPHVNTERSFTVSAWARLDKKPEGAAVITAQAGKNKPGFELYYSSVYNRWAFNQYSADTADATPVRAMQPDGTTANIDTWVHLVGVHDTIANTLTLYVNGAKAGSTSLVNAFYADQSMYIGAGNYSGAMAAYFPGTIDDVRVLDRPVSAEEVQQMYRQRSLVNGRWNFESITTTTPVTTPDLSTGNRPMSLYGGATLGESQIDTNGLQLDGVNAYAATSAMPVDTSGSFTVTAWAKAAATPDHPLTVVSAEGATRSAFDITYQPDTSANPGPGRWEISLPDKDATDAVVNQAGNTEFDDVTNWNHLTLVYDGFAREARLYVNGVLQDSQGACGDDTGDGSAADTACMGAWADNVLTFKASRSLQVGRSQSDATGTYFAGAIDDVWAFQGALNDSQVQELAGAWFDIPTEVPAGRS